LVLSPAGVLIKRKQEKKTLVLRGKKVNGRGAGMKPCLPRPSLPASLGERILKNRIFFRINDLNLEI